MLPASRSRASSRFRDESPAEAGLADRADVKLIDYRDLTGKFDKIVSIEMFEAVGQAYWETYFRAVSALLKDGGRAVLQAITIEDNAFDEYVREPDFIQRYIFPGGMLPSMPRLEQPVAEAGLRWSRKTDLGSITHARSPNGGTDFRPPGLNLRRANSTAVSSGCGSFTCPIVKAGFVPA